jgi:5-methylcytosine-specific restriction endonuclease McrA
MKEIWKPIKGYEKYYHISNLGKIKRLEYIDKRNKFNDEKIISQYTSNKGFLTASFHINGKRILKSVHIIMAQVFIDNYDNKKHIVFLDGNKQNININNLKMYISTRDNTAYQRMYYINNKERLNKQNNKYKKQNKEYLKIKNKKYRESNRGKEVNKRWHIANKEKRRGYKKEWRKINPESSRYFSKLRKMLKKGLVPSFSNKKIIRKFYDDRPPGYHVDHIIPISKGGPHCIENLQYLTASENLKEHNSMPKTISIKLAYVFHRLNLQDDKIYEIDRIF